MEKEWINECILRVEKGNIVYSHQRLVLLFMRNEGCNLEDAITMVDMYSSDLKIEHEEPSEELNILLHKKE